jgi:hypothetical protein
MCRLYVFYVCVCCVLFFSVYEGFPTWHRDYSVRGGGENAESIEWFIEYQALFRSYDLVPRPPLPSYPISKLSLFLSLPVCHRPVELTDGRFSGRRWARSQIKRSRENLPSMNHSILSGGMGWDDRYEFSPTCALCILDLGGQKGIFTESFLLWATGGHQNQIWRKIYHSIEWDRATCFCRLYIDATCQAGSGFVLHSHAKLIQSSLFKDLKTALHTTF